MLNKVEFALKVVKTYKNWSDVFLDHLGHFPIYKRKTYFLRNGIKMETRCQTLDLGTIHTIFMGNETLDAVKSLGNSPTVIDLGSHIGAFSIYIAHKTQGSKIYSYEPFRDNYEIMVENITINDFEKNIISFNLAVSDKNGNRVLYFDKKYNGGCTLLENVWDKSNSLIINCTTLKDIFKTNRITRCDLLKIDCEGYDYRILKSLPKIYFKRIEAVLCEFHTNEQLELTKKLLEKNGFRIKSVSRGVSYGNIYANKM